MTNACIRIALACALGASLAAPAGAQQQVERQQITITGGGENIQVTPMGPGRQLRTGTSSISGRVFASDSGNPLRRAQVRVSGSDIASKVALTDAQGRYRFTDLPDGRFTVSSTKSGYVTVQYGQTRAYESGKTIELAEKQALDKIDIAMPRGGVIIGRIVDEFGEPVAEAMVSVMRQTWTNGRRRLVNAGRTATTNDLGQYRMYGLAPGDYFVSATVRNTDFPLMDMAAVGAQAGVVSMPAAPATPSSGYAPTYFPGTATPSEAQRVSVAVGEERSGADFALVAVKLARITGIVMNSEGRPLEGAMVAVEPARGGDVLFGIGGGGRTNRDGAFAINNVAPGEYNLAVRSVTVVTQNAGNQMVFTTRISGGEGGDSEFASVPVAVAGEDLANLVITTTKGASATGRVTFEGGAKPPSAATLRVTATSADGGPMMMPGGGGNGTVKPDGTFELKGLAGLRVLRVAGLPTGWTLKAVQLNGLDVTDGGIDFKGAEGVSGLEIVLTNKPTTITGGVTTADGTPVKDYTVVFFAEDPQKWVAPSSRWVVGTRPDNDGHYKIGTLPPGSYYAIAVDYIPQGEWGDPELLDRLRTKAQRVDVNEGESRTLDLKISDM
jgi:carboxypeptidase family protein